MLTRKQRAENRKSFISSYKKLLGCTDCGYNLHSEVLEFDHLNNKYRNVASLFYSSWKTIFAEIDKCDIVCANCHRLRTFKRLLEDKPFRERAYLLSSA